MSRKQEIELVECSGHMGWTPTDYPGCREREQKKLRQAELAFEDHAAEQYK